MTRDEICLFCEIVSGSAPASFVDANDLAVAFLDLRQFHPGHVLIVPRAHVSDIRGADDDTAAAVIRMVARIARAVDAVFPADGLSVWHSAGAGANQEVPHLHFHVHPRRVGDGLLQIYPQSPAQPDRITLDEWGDRVRSALSDASAA
jgi:histidine triad (HIT) family protein